jgi:hypothetical protein
MNEKEKEHFLRLLTHYSLLNYTKDVPSDKGSSLEVSLLLAPRWEGRYHMRAL